jgi:hypothetical protein
MVDYQRNRFYDPLTGETYLWQVNHSDEDRFGRDRNITYGAPTGNTGPVRFQGDKTPIVLQLSGVIFHQAQYEAMVSWFERCERQSILFTDFTGAGAEVIITSFQPTRVWTARNPRDASIPLHFWRYQMTMEVIRGFEGPWDNY